MLLNYFLDILLVHESALILLQTVPTHIQLDDIQRKLLSQVEGVLAVHEFHVWQLAGDRIIASAHIRYAVYTCLICLISCLSFKFCFLNDKDAAIYLIT